MAGATITQRIALEGADQIRQALAQIGRVGQETFAQIQAAGEKVKIDKPLGSVETAANRVGAALDGVRGRASGTTAALGTTSAAAQGLGTQVGAAAGAMSAAERAGVALGRSVIGVGAALRGAGSAAGGGASQFTNLNFGVTSVTGAFRTAVGEVLKTTAALGALPATLFALAKSASTTASEVRSNALAAGTSTDAYQEFAAAAGKLGGEQEQLAQAFAVIQDNAANVQKAITDSEKAHRRFVSSGTPGIEEMNRHYTELREKVADAGGAFARYGIAVTEAGGKSRDPIAVFKDIADNIAAIPDPADRAARAVDLFGGKVGQQLVPLLSKGSEGIEKITRQLRGDGLILTPTQIGVGVEMNRAVGQLQFSVTRLKDSIGLLFAPQFTEAANIFRKAITDSRASLVAFAADVAIRTRPVLLDLVRVMSGQDGDVQTGWIITAKNRILEFGAAVSTVVTTIVIPLFQGLAAIMNQVANGINAVFGTKITAADIVVTLIIAKLIGGFLSLLGVLAVFKGAWVLLAGIVAALGGPLTIVLTLVRGLAGLFAIVAQAAVALVVAAGGVPLLLAAVGAALGFIAVRIAQGFNWRQIAEGASQAVQSIVSAFGALWETITGLFVAGLESLSALWSALVGTAQVAWTSVVTGAQSMWSSITGSFSSGINTVIASLTRVRDFAVGVWNAITGAANGAAAAQGNAAGGSASGFAHGGPIHGPGTSTSDSVPIWASAGEFMVRAAAVRKYGVAIFHALNGMRLPKGAFQGFAQGGLVERLQHMMPPMLPLRLADGGEIPSIASAAMRPINLQIGSELFAGLLAPEDVAQKLVRSAVAKQLRSAGRKPSYV